MYYSVIKSDKNRTKKAKNCKNQFFKSLIVSMLKNKKLFGKFNSHPRYNHKLNVRRSQAS